VDAVIDSNVRDETANILKTLSPKEDSVIRLRFGIGWDAFDVTFVVVW